jgi:hypothetical protein
MTTKPTDLVKKIKQATDYQTNKQILREKINADLHITFNGGMFKADRTLIAFLSSLTRDEVIIEDIYENPIKVDRKRLLMLTKEHYQLVMNRWLIEHAEIQRARKL